MKKSTKIFILLSVIILPVTSFMVGKYCYPKTVTIRELQDPEMVFWGNKPTLKELCAGLNSRVYRVSGFKIDSFYVGQFISRGGRWYVNNEGRAQVDYRATYDDSVKFYYNLNDAKTELCKKLGTIKDSVCNSIVK